MFSLSRFLGMLSLLEYFYNFQLTKPERLHNNKILGRES
jgi:hypothetical protein